MKILLLDYQRVWKIGKNKYAIEDKKGNLSIEEADRIIRTYERMKIGSRLMRIDDIPHLERVEAKE